jgi:hypothetical protein
MARCGSTKQGAPSCAGSRRSCCRSRQFSECTLLPVSEPASGDLELTPESRLAGLRLRGADGAFVPFALHGAGGKHALLNIVVASSLAAADTVTASAEGIGTLRWPTSAIAWTADVGTLDVGTAARGADLIVTPSGGNPSSLTGSDCCLVTRTASARNCVTPMVASAPPTSCPATTRCAGRSQIDLAPSLPTRW